MATSTIKLYDLKGTRSPDDKLSWSPNTWKARYLLNIKDLDYHSEYLHFLEIPDTVRKLVPDTAFPTVPCITDTNGQTIQDSRKIALYIDEKHPTPSVFQGGVGVHFFFENWIMNGLSRRIFQLSVMKMFPLMDEEAQHYYRQSREKMLGTSLENIAGEPEEHIGAINNDLAEIDKILEDYDYVTGDKVGWADIVLASMLKLAQITRPDVFESRLINQHSNIKHWWERMEKHANNSK
ncbi:hypothetical protein INT43_001708 [Umbelopsis isabellina]|uniref:Glutathione S-transferase n=1 Tax=Mortierella isabellina TaxID=91625 RepID=A0A8H7PRC2_MORIS|nr:hypothetical protein INT43_001708 [Umbelopsis isabellina]